MGICVVIPAGSSAHTWGSGVDPSLYAEVEICKTMGSAIGSCASIRLTVAALEAKTVGFTLSVPERETCNTSFPSILLSFNILKATVVDGAPGAIVAEAGSS